MLPGQKISKFDVKVLVPGKKTDSSGLEPTGKTAEEKWQSLDLDDLERQDRTFSFRVETPPGHELSEVGLAEKELRNLARDSGGEFYREEDLHRLAGGQRIVSGDDNTVKVWDARTGVELLTLKGHTGDVTSIAVSRDGQRIASASMTTTLRSGTPAAAPNCSRSRGTPPR